MREISTEGLAAIKQHEGLRLNAYRCPADVPTIGYGSTGKHVSMGMSITESEAEALLRKDVARFEECVNAYPTVPLSQGQFDALVSFAFNLGCGALKTSTLLKKLNRGDYQGAADQLPRWNKAGGKALAGLTRRRNEERDMFLS